MARFPIGLIHKLARYCLCMRGSAMVMKALSQCGPVQAVMGLAWRIREGGGARSGHAGVLGGSNGPKDKKSRAGSEELSWVTP